MLAVTQHQGTFLHQTRRAKVQERRQQATLGGIGCIKPRVLAQILSGEVSWEYF